MWTHKDNRIFLDISKVNRSEFKVVDDLQAGFHLVLPRKESGFGMKIGGCDLLL